MGRGVMREPTDFIVEYRDINLNRQGQIPSEDLSIKLQPVRNGVGSWAISLPQEHRAVSYLQTPGSGIIVTDIETGRIVMSGPTSKPSRKATSDDVIGTTTIAGISDDCVLWDARAWPSPGLAVEAQADGYDVRTGAAETVMREYVHFNIGPGSMVSRRSRLASKMTLAANLGRGVSVTKSARFPILGELLNEIATVADLTFRVVQVGDHLEFQVHAVEDRRAEIRLDINNGTLDEQGVETAPPSTTRVIVAGQGVGAERTLLLRTSAASLEAENLWGRKMEEFKDQRNTDDMDELIQAGDEILEEDGFTRVSVKAVPSNDLTMVYGKHWVEGDRITVVVDGQETWSTVTEAALIIDQEGVQIGAAIGDVADFNSASALRTSLEDTQKRVDHLERNVEASSAETLFPAGTMSMGAWTEAPAGWLLCDGRQVPRAIYPRLYAAIGNQFALAGDTGLSFRLPDMRGRFGVGVNPGDASYDTVGDKGGAKNTILQGGQMPEFIPVTKANAPSQSTGTADNGGNSVQAGLHTGRFNANLGTGNSTPDPVPTLPPYVAFNYAIKY
jgi:microcystin-dependent protein